MRRNPGSRQRLPRRCRRRSRLRSRNRLRRLNLRWKNGHFEWEDADFGLYPLTLDTPPEPTTLAAIVQVVGAKANAIAPRFESSHE